MTLSRIRNWRGSGTQRQEGMMGESTARKVYEAYMAVRTGGNVDECRAVLRALRVEVGDVAFETAKARAIGFDSRRNVR